MRVFLFLGVLLLAPSAWAGSITTDRPGNGNAATTVNARRSQVETSLGYQLEPQDGDDIHLISFPTLFRFGLPGNFELRAGTGIVGIDVTSDVRADPTDTLLGFKLQLMTNDGAIPDFAVMLDVFFPSGRRRFASDAVVPDARLAASWSLPAALGLLLNVGVVSPKDPERHVRLLYVVNLGFAPAGFGGLSLFVEGFGLIAFSGDRDQVIQIDAGLAYLINDNAQVDLFTQHALTDGSPNFQLGVGFSLRI